MKGRPEVPGAEITSIESIVVAGLGMVLSGSWYPVSPTLPMNTVRPADSHSGSIRRVLVRRDSHRATCARGTLSA